MKTKILTLILMLSAIVAVQAQTWKKYEDKGGFMSLDLPAEFKITEDNNAQQKFRSINSEYGDYSIYINVTDYNFDVKGDPKTLSAELVMAGLGEDAQIKKVIPFSLNGKPGTRAIISIPSQKFYIEKAVIISGNHSYIVKMIRSTQDGNDITNRVFSSIALKG